MLSEPEGPSNSAFKGVCPKFTRLGRFEGNRAHSSMFYGLRIFPEFYPSSNPCGSGDQGNSIKAEFRGLTSYKNGMKCAIATQVRTAWPMFTHFASVHASVHDCCQVTKPARLRMLLCKTERTTPL
jgi:hypothetical protein